MTPPAPNPTRISVPEETWTMRGADERLTIMRRPQGCYDLVLDGTHSVAYLTGCGRPISDLLASAGIAFRRLGDPAGPLDPPPPATAEAVLAELVAAVEALGIVAPGPKPWADRCSDVGIAPPRGRNRAASTVSALFVAHEKARAVLARRPAPTTPTPTPTTT